MIREINIHVSLVSDEIKDTSFQNSKQGQGHADYLDFVISMTSLIHRYDCRKDYDNIEYLNAKFLSTI